MKFFLIIYSYVIIGRTRFLCLFIKKRREQKRKKWIEETFPPDIYNCVISWENKGGGFRIERRL